MKTYIVTLINKESGKITYKYVESNDTHKVRFEALKFIKSLGKNKNDFEIIINEAKVLKPS